MNFAHCVHCGTRCELLAEGPDDLRPCPKCGKRPYDPVELLFDLAYLGDTMRLCPVEGCRKPNRFNPYCFRCGHAFS